MLTISAAGAPQAQWFLHRQCQAVERDSSTRSHHLSTGAAIEATAATVLSLEGTPTVTDGTYTGTEDERRTHADMDPTITASQRPPPRRDHLLAGRPVRPGAARSTRPPSDLMVCAGKWDSLTVAGGTITVKRRWGCSQVRPGTTTISPRATCRLSMELSPRTGRRRHDAYTDAIARRQFPVDHLGWGRRPASPLQGSARASRLRPTSLLTAARPPSMPGMTSTQWCPLRPSAPARSVRPADDGVHHRGRGRL